MSLDFFSPPGIRMKREMNFLTPGVRGVKILTYEELGSTKSFNCFSDKEKSFNTWTLDHQ